MDILEEIIAHKRIENERNRQIMPLRKLATEVDRLMESKGQQAEGGSMRKALIDSTSGIIAEFKRRSPSKGWIHQSALATEVPLSYQQHGAAALSILTDETYFGGNDSFIVDARQSGVTIPVLYKNFVIDEYQLLQARRCGASAVLLIAAAIDHDTCSQLCREAHNLGMEVLLEMHGERDLDYADLAPDLYGINNRNMGSFVTDVENSFHMASRLPKEGCKVSESGLSNPETVNSLRLAGYRGFLMGEQFMKQEHPGLALDVFIKDLAR